MLKRNKPLKRNAAGTLKRRTPIRRVSLKRASQIREYSKLRATYLELHPICEVWCRENGWQWISGNEYVSQLSERVTGDWLISILHAPRATEIHHVNKRRGAMLNDETHWLAVCRRNHDRIENDKAWARREVYLLNF